MPIIGMSFKTLRNSDDEEENLEVLAQRFHLNSHVTSKVKITLHVLLIDSES